jgi:hypothetical protein
MLLRLFIRKQQFIIVLILILALAFWVPSILNYKSSFFIFDFYPSPVYSPLQFVEYSFPRITVIISLILLVLSGFLLIRLNVRFFFIQTRTQLPALFFILICSSFIPLQRLNPVSISVIFLIIALFKIFDTYKKEQLCYNFFDAALLISVGSLFYFNLIFLIVIIWIGLLILRPFIWREWIFTLIGLLLPYMILFFYYYMMDLDIKSLLGTYKSYLSYKRYDMSFDLSYRLLAIYYLLILIISSIYMIKVYAVKKIYARKFFMFFLWLFIVAVIIYFFIPSAGYEMIIIASLPVSFLLTHFFVSVKPNWINSTLFDMFFGFLIYLRIVNL